MGMIYNPQTMRYEFVPDYATPNYQQTKSPNINQGLIWVSGENEARTWNVPPNGSVLLMDSDSNHFYIKSSDNTGKPNMKMYEYKEVQAVNTQSMVQNVDNSEINREIERIKTQLSDLAEKYESLKPKKAPAKKEADNE